MSEPRKHHYVPVFYQKYFVNSKEMLWLYDRRDKTYKELSPRSICCEKDLYAIKPEGAPRKREVETKGLSVVDGMAASAFRELILGKTPSNETFQTIAYFLAIQFNRVPAMEKMVTATYEGGATGVMRTMAANVERMKSVLDDYANKTGNSIDVTPEAMVEAVRKDQIEVVATEVPFLQSIFSQAEHLSKFIERLDWQLLVAPYETGFILCDCPVVVVPPMNSRDIGFGIPEAVKYFPVTRNLCLRLGDVGSSYSRRKISKETARLVNFNIAANSERFIMGPDRAQLQNIVTGSGSTDPDTKPRYAIKTEQGEDGGSMEITFLPRRYFYLKNSAP